ncbi:MAG: IS982 family transposase, partial [Bacteroidales bacterium]|nr:IS982 family transposase [Bacteroidales bacterium]
MSDSEIITILILYHLSGYKNFKVFYTNGVQIGLKNDFPKTVSYNRFLELREKVFIPMACLLKNKLLSKCTGISFIDSTPLKVCDLHRIGLHKTLKLYANKGKCSMGWFYGFKLHIICNE